MAASLIALGLLLALAGVCLLAGLGLAKRPRSGKLSLAGALLLLAAGGGLAFLAELKEYRASGTLHLATILTMLAFLAGLGLAMFLIWAVRTGQFKDVEGIKYRMLQREASARPAEQEKTEQRKTDSLGEPR